jgi:hypothetical protein
LSTEQNLDVNVGIGAMQTAPNLKIGQLWYDSLPLPSFLRLGSTPLKTIGMLMTKLVVLHLRFKWSSRVLDLSILGSDEFVIVRECSSLSASLSDLYF